MKQTSKIVLGTHTLQTAATSTCVAGIVCNVLVILLHSDIGLKRMLRAYRQDQQGR